MINLRGQTFGKWTVIEETERLARTQRRWLCRCRCGRVKTVSQQTLTMGTSTQCPGCRATKHGMAHDRVYLLVNMARSRAKKIGVPCTLDWRDIAVPEKCPLLGIPLKFSNKRMHPNNPSLDRIDPKKGYTKENVWVVSWRANTIKHNATLQELEMLTANLRDRILISGAS